MEQHSRPVCDYCNNKVHDNTYVWIEWDKKLVHKVCKIITNEMKKDVQINVSPIKMGIKLR